MEIEKAYERLKNIIKPLKRVIVAFSGGVDSTLLLKASLDALSRENVLALIASSPTYPKSEIEEAKKVAESLGAEVICVESKEMEDEEFLKNTPDRCYHCKRHLFEVAERIRRERNFLYILEGSNKDDLSDLRPGRKACEELGVKSPLLLADLSKKDIREISEYLSLPTSKKPSFACLSSRIPYGTRIEEKILKMVEEAEAFLKKLGLSQIRVRYHGNLARIEVEEKDMEKVFAERKRIYERLKEIGFVYVTLDLMGYRSGSMNEALF